MADRRRDLQAFLQVEGQPDKQKVGQGVYNLGRVDGGIVVLVLVRLEGRVLKDGYDEPPHTSSV